MLPVRGATEAFYAYPATDEVIEVGTPVVVVDFDPPRTRLRRSRLLKHP